MLRIRVLPPVVPHWNGTNEQTTRYSSKVSAHLIGESVAKYCFNTHKEWSLYSYEVQRRNRGFWHNNPIVNKNKGRGPKVGVLPSPAHSKATQQGRRYFKVKFKIFVFRLSIEKWFVETFNLKQKNNRFGFLGVQKWNEHLFINT